jgi:hypothetical protein
MHRSACTWLALCLDTQLFVLPDDVQDFSLTPFSASSRQGLSRQSNRSPNSQLQLESGHVPPPLPSPTLQQNRGSSTSPVPPSPGLNSNMSLPDHASASGHQPASRRPPYFFREEYAGLIVKGNFMTLAAKPVHVEDGEWLAHQGSLTSTCTLLQAYTAFSR